MAVVGLRAGLATLPPFLEAVPEASVGLLGLERRDADGTHLDDGKLPSEARGGRVVLLDPTLATGSTARTALQRLREEGAERLLSATLVAAPEGLDRVERSAPGAELFTAAVDPGLSVDRLIVPGLGDSGDRLFGTV